MDGVNKLHVYMRHVVGGFIQDIYGGSNKAEYDTSIATSMDEEEEEEVSSSSTASGRRTFTAPQVGH